MDKVRAQIESLASSAAADKAALEKVRAEIGALSKTVEGLKRRGPTVETASSSASAGAHEKERLELEKALVHQRAVLMTTRLECEKVKKAIDENRASKTSIVSAEGATIKDGEATRAETATLGHRVAELQAQQDEVGRRLAQDEESTKRELERLTEELRETSRQIHQEGLKGATVKIASRAMTPSASAPTLPSLATPSRLAAPSQGRIIKSEGKPPPPRRIFPKASPVKKAIAELAASGKQPSVGQIREAVLASLEAAAAAALATGKTESEGATARDVDEAEEALANLQSMLEKASGIEGAASRDELFESLQRKKESVDSEYRRLASLSAEAEHVRARLAAGWALQAEEGKRSDEIEKCRLQEVADLDRRLALAKQDAALVRAERDKSAQLGKSLKSGLKRLLLVLAGEATDEALREGEAQEEEERGSKERTEDNLASLFPQVEANLAATLAVYAREIHKATIPVALPPATLALALQHRHQERKRGADSAPASAASTARSSHLEHAADEKTVNELPAPTPPVLSPLAIPPRQSTQSAAVKPSSSSSAAKAERFPAGRAPLSVLPTSSATVGPTAILSPASAAKHGVKAAIPVPTKTPKAASCTDSASSSQPPPPVKPLPLPLPALLKRPLSSIDGLATGVTSSTVAATEGSGKRAPFSLTPVHLANRDRAGVPVSVAAVTGIEDVKALKRVPSSASKGDTYLLPPVQGRQGVLSAAAIAAYSSSVNFSPKGKQQSFSWKKQSFLRGGAPASGRRGVAFASSASAPALPSPTHSEEAAPTPILALDDLLAGPSFAPMAVVAPPSSRLPEDDEEEDEEEKGQQQNTARNQQKHVRQEKPKSETARLNQSTARLLNKIKEGNNPLSAGPKARPREEEGKVSSSRPSSASSDVSVPSLPTLSSTRLKAGSRGLYAS